MPRKLMDVHHRHKANCQDLLRDLKTTVEGLLVGQLDNVWCVYGGLNRLHNDISRIFENGCKTSANDKNYSNFWNFIQGLDWLHPNLCKGTLSIDCEYKPHMPQHMKNDKAAIWLYKNLENHTLSQKLSWLLSDKKHLNSCYESNAYLSKEEYAEALLICLRAIERNHSSLLSDINPSLFLGSMEAQHYHKAHRRCFSFPEAHVKIIRQIDVKKQQQSKPINSNKIKMRLWKSLPNLQCKQNAVPVRKRSKSAIPKNKPSDIIDGETKTSSMDHQQKDCRKESDRINHSQKRVKCIIFNNKEIIEHTPSPSTSSSFNSTKDYHVNYEASTSLPLNLTTTTKHKSLLSPPRSKLEYNILDSLSGIPGEKDYKKQPKKTFIEDGGMSVLPMSTGFIPRPTKGQSLSEFLTSGQFAKANAELDRENAHFSISEAMIAAVEQFKCHKQLNIEDEHIIDESDEEIRGLKQRIRLRRREKLVEKQKKMCFSLLSDGKTETTTTEPSESSSSSFYSTSDSVRSDEDVEDLQMDEANNLKDNLGLSMSMASLYSESDLFSSKRHRGAPDGASDILSAEGVALSLISRFNDKHLPRASDLDWLVSEEDAPQALLPLPKSWPVCPDTNELEEKTSLRGTREWAPPRPQIIFTMHPPPSRNKLMARQNYRCAGCGMRVAEQYASKFRYCNYLGRYFCTGCHTNQLALIPARILHKWDFTRYIVSTFSYRLLEQMYMDPLFRIFELDRTIERRCKNLEIARKYRTGLYYLKDFILTCRFAEIIQDTLKTEPTYLYQDPEVYSINDLVNVRTGIMKSKLKYLVEVCCRHVAECELCNARGFICEICKSSDVIFPWQMRIVTRCSRCGTCYHLSCWKKTTNFDKDDNNPCVRCKRKANRHNS